MADQINSLVARQRAHFASGSTRAPAAREEALRALMAGLERREADIFEALYADLGKSPGESYISEIGLIRQEAAFALKHLRRWAAPRRAATPFFILPGKSAVYPEPYGLTLNISPWNYPFYLSLMPLIGALAAGNCMVLKPSRKAPASAALLEELLREALGEELAAAPRLEDGGADALLRAGFDFIFYTGSARVGKIVMAAAAERLTPVCLELGGKCPAIVLADADLARAARHIAWGKSLNAGQTCVAPDYVLAEAPVKERLAALLRGEFARFPGPQPTQNEDYTRIVSHESLERLLRLSGGRAEADFETRRMAPLLMDEARPDDPVMQEEIFGPLLPLLSVDSPEAAAALVNAGEAPLAAYIFSRSARRAGAILEQISCGGACVNDAMLHMSNPRLPFGGVGASGMGRYRGKAGFDLFSNHKSVLFKGPWPDIALRYPPYSQSRLRWIKRILR